MLGPRPGTLTNSAKHTAFIVKHIHAEAWLSYNTSSYLLFWTKLFKIHIPQDDQNADAIDNLSGAIPKPQNENYLDSLPSLLTSLNMVSFQLLGEIICSVYRGN